MPRNYKRKTNRANWSADLMQKALDAVKDGMPYRSASKKYMVPIMSLKRRAKGTNKVALGAVKFLGGKRTVFTAAQVKPSTSSATENPSPSTFAEEDNSADVRTSPESVDKEESEEPSVKQEDAEYEIDFDDPLDSYDTTYKDESSWENSSSLPKKAKKSQPEFARASSSFPESGSLPHHDDNKTFEDQYDVFGKNVTVKLRSIAAKDNTQRLMAEKIINDALFMAELGKLEMEHCSKLHAE